MKINELFSHLNHFFALYKNNPSAVSIHKKILAVSERITEIEDVADAIDKFKSLYEDSIKMLEHEIVVAGFDHRLLDLQKRIFRELEHLLSFARHDSRHHIMVVIPVADRPALLSNCLESLKEQCRIFQYGGTSVNKKAKTVYNKVSIFIFDDSKELSNKKDIEALSSKLDDFGIRTYYVGRDKQSSILQQIPHALKKDIFRIIGHDSDAALPHKGASVIRNIAYLYMHSFIKECGERTLLYFIDSDEEFSITIRSGETATNIPFINYFYWLDAMFDSMDIDVLTGKVVGDPPVSPAVMINTFLQDLILFFEIISGFEELDRCSFHETVPLDSFAADYHDMVSLFGYQPPPASKKYVCRLTGKHTIKESIQDFSWIVIGFFYGVHHTRTQWYRHEKDVTDIQKARTVYTGNYILNLKGLRHFIPFAHLNLRMAGPTLGRILKKQIKDRFGSANLPLSHNRVLSDNTMHEFRSGVFKNKETFDLSEEFFRQFWGDVMLFSVESLTESGYPDRTVSVDEISTVVSAVQEKLFHLYKEKQHITIARNRKLAHYLTDNRYWWNTNDHMHDTISRFKRFSQLVDENFGAESKNLEVISDWITEGIWPEKIIHAIHDFYRDTALWDSILKADITIKNSS
jgi:hypothetical protein